MSAYQIGFALGDRLALSMAQAVKRHWFAILFVAAAVVRLAALNAAPLWYDEAGAVWMASLPLARLVAATAADVHPPLFFLLIKPLFALFGPAPWAMRLPSVLLSLAALPVLKAICQEIGMSTRATAIALGLMAFSAFEVWYAQEARMYALLQLCALGMVLFGLKRQWIGFVACAGLGMYAQNFGLIYWAAMAAVVLAIELWRALYEVVKTAEPLNLDEFCKVAVACLVPLMAWAPWAFALAGQLRDYAADWIPQVTLGGWLQPLIEWWWPGALVAGWYAAAALAALGLTLFALGHLITHPTKAGALTAWLVFAPMVAAAMVSLAWRPMYISRPFIVGAPFAYALIAQAIAHTPRRAAWMAAALVPLVAANLIAYYPDVVRAKASELPATKVVNVIRANWQEGDVIYHGNVGSVLPMWPYTYNTGEPQYLMPVVGYSAGMLRTGTRRALGMVEVPLDAVQWQRAWVIWTAGPTIDTAEDAAIAALVARYPHKTFLHFNNGAAVFDLWLMWNATNAVGN